MNTEFVLECKGVGHWFGSHHVLHDVTFQVIRGEIVGLVGPSGCGKSTLLRAVVGTHPPERGDVLVYARGASTGTPVRGPGRDRGIVYQRYSLFPFLTAQENVAFGLMLDQTTIPFRLFKRSKWRELKKSHMEEAGELLRKLGLEKAIGLYPKQMSGGMCQRVAIAQALIMKPEILLLDEPFGALDEATREELQRMLLTLYLENRAAKQKGEKPPYTILIVTHELNEALYVGDRHGNGRVVNRSIQRRRRIGARLHAPLARRAVRVGRGDRGGAPIESLHRMHGAEARAPAALPLEARAHQDPDGAQSE